MSEPTISLRDALQIAYVVAILGEAGEHSAVAEARKAIGAALREPLDHHSLDHIVVEVVAHNNPAYDRALKTVPIVNTGPV